MPEIPNGTIRCSKRYPPVIVAANLAVVSDSLAVTFAIQAVLLPFKETVLEE